MDFIEKNAKVIIGGLVALLVFCSIWGSINNRAAKTLQYELNAVTAEEQAGKVEPAKEAHEAEVVVVEDPRVQELEAQIAELQAKEKMVGEKVEQVKQARHDLEEVRKANKRLEGQVVQQQNRVTQLKKALSTKKKQAAAAAKEVKALQDQVAKLTREGVGAEERITALVAAEAQAQETVAALQAEVQAAQETIAAAREQEALAVQQKEAMAAQAALDLEMAEAQVIGLEKIVEEQDVLLEETSSKLDKAEVNMDILLGKISTMQDALQELEQENVELIQQLTNKKTQLDNLQGQVEQQPDPQQ